MPKLWLITWNTNREGDADGIHEGEVFATTEEDAEHIKDILVTSRYVHVVYVLTSDERESVYYA